MGIEICFTVNIQFDGRTGKIQQGGEYYGRTTGRGYARNGEERRTL